MNMTLHTRITTAVFVVLLSGCASKEPTFGNSVQAEGKAVAEIGKQWDRGQAMIRRGNRLIRTGNERIAEGNENVSEGTAMVKSGEKMVSESEAAYEANKPTVPVN